MYYIVCSVVVPFRKHVLSWPSASKWYYVFTHQLVATQCALCILCNASRRSCVCFVWLCRNWMTTVCVNVNMNVWVGCARLSARQPTLWLWMTAYLCVDLTLYDLMWSFSARLSVCVCLLCGWVRMTRLPSIGQLAMVAQRWSPSSWQQKLRWMPGIR